MMGPLVLSITILFTQNFRDRFDVNWKSHKAILSQGRVLDKKYAYGPMTIKKWTDLFNYEKGPCQQIDSMAQYDDLSDENCFLIIDSL